jgi:hypothetical protein
MRCSPTPKSIRSSTRTPDTGPIAAARRANPFRPWHLAVAEVAGTLHHEQTSRCSTVRSGGMADRPQTVHADRDNPKRRG